MPRVLEKNVCFPAKSSTIRGIRIAYLTDIHWDTKESQKYAEDVSIRINKLNPDLILFGGDLIRWLEDTDPAIDFLSSLKAKTGKLAVLGNWERPMKWRTDEDWKTLFARSGFELLINEAVHFGKLTIAGVDDYRYGKPDFSCCRPITEDQTVITLSHFADAVADQNPPFPGHLILCGHTHGGQWRLPGFGAVVTSSEYWKTFEYGWYKHTSKHTLLYVSSGLGFTGRSPFRFRFNCPPEILSVELR